MARLFMVIPAAQRAAVRTALTPYVEGPEGMFEPELSADGAPPATHYMAAGEYTLTTAAAIQTLFNNSYPEAVCEVYDPIGDPGFPYRALEGLGLMRVEEQ